MVTKLEGTEPDTIALIEHAAERGSKAAVAITFAYGVRIFTIETVVCDVFDGDRRCVAIVELGDVPTNSNYSDT